MKITAFFAAFFLSLSIHAFDSEAIEQLSSLIKPGTYQGSFENNKCSLTFSVKNNIAYLQLKNANNTLSHEFTDHEGIIFEDWKGDFMSNYINRTNDVTVYSMDTFRIIKNEDVTYVVIEKLQINNRDTNRKIIECYL